MPQLGLISRSLLIRRIILTSQHDHVELTARLFPPQAFANTNSQMLFPNQNSILYISISTAQFIIHSVEIIIKKSGHSSLIF